MFWVETTAIATTVFYTPLLPYYYTSAWKTEVLELALSGPASTATSGVLFREVKEL